MNPAIVVGSLVVCGIITVTIYLLNRPRANQYGHERPRRSGNSRDERQSRRPNSIPAFPSLDSRRPRFYIFNDWPGYNNGHHFIVDFTLPYTTTVRDVRAALAEYMGKMVRLVGLRRQVGMVDDRPVFQVGYSEYADGDGRLWDEDLVTNQDWKRLRNDADPFRVVPRQLNYLTVTRLGNRSMI